MPPSDAKPNKPKGYWGKRLALVLAFIAFAPLLAPQFLLFPYAKRFGDTIIYSESEITPAFATALAQSDKLLRASAVYGDDYDHVIVLTNGGWRWKWLAFGANGAFAINRPLTTNMVFNRTDIAAGKIYNGRDMGGERSLASVIAHERTHALIRQHFGFVQATTFPNWKVEGYADYIAQESSLSADDVAKLKASGQDHPALIYYQGHQDVARILAKNGGSVDKLFASD